MWRNTHREKEPEVDRRVVELLVSIQSLPLRPSGGLGKLMEIRFCSTSIRLEKSLTWPENTERWHGYKARDKTGVRLGSIRLWRTAW